MSEMNTNHKDSYCLDSLRIDQISSLIWIGLGIFVVYSSYGLEYMDEYGPKGGFLPLWLGIILIILGLALGATAMFSGHRREKVTFAGRANALKILFILIGYFCFVYLTEFASIGFYISIGMLSLFLLAFVEKRGWIFSIVTGVVVTISLWLLFEVIFNTGLPPGPLSLQYLKYR